MLRSTFSGFSMAQHALLASQRAIDVVGQNLSNVNTAGYTRQRLDLMSISPVQNSMGGAVSETMVGQGVFMDGVTQIRDPFLDIQFRNQLSKVGTADAADQVLEQIGNIFDETDGSAVRTTYNEVISQLKMMASSSTAGESSSEALVRASMDSLLAIIRDNGSDLTELKEDTVANFEESVLFNVQTIVDEVLILNETIRNYQIMGNESLELQDQRNLLLDDLATYIPIEVTYKTEHINGEEVDNLFVAFKDATGTSHNIIAQDKGGFFTMTPTTGIPVTLTFTDAEDPTKVTDVSDIMGDGVIKGNLDMMNQSEVFDGTDIKGIGYYEGIFNKFVDTFAKTLNKMNAVTAADGTVTEMPLFETDDGTTDFTATNIRLSEGWLDGSVTLKKSLDGTVSPGTTDYSNILYMIETLTETNMEFKETVGGREVVVFSGSIQDCYDNIQNMQAVDRKANMVILDSRVEVLSQAEGLRASVSEVNSDEEVMDMMRFQQSYNAASRMMTTLDEMLDKLINSTGVVGR